MKRKIKRQVKELGILNFLNRSKSPNLKKWSSFSKQYRKNLGLLSNSFSLIMKLNMLLPKAREISWI